MSRCPAWSAIVLLTSLAACGGPAAPLAVRVFAAASLTAAFQDLAHEFAAAEPGIAIETHFAGSPQLVLQITQGADADVFAAADEANMQKVVAAGRTVGAPVLFAQNRLAIVVPAGNPCGMRTLADLARPELRVAWCGPEVPAGRYARQALRAAGVTATSRSDEPSVTALVGKVQLGELDAALAFATDARKPGLEGVSLPAAHDVVADYPIAVLNGGRDPAGAARFVAFVRGEHGQAVLARHGFATP